MANFFCDFFDAESFFQRLRGASVNRFLIEADKISTFLNMKINSLKTSL
jgi:hypothetical protein